jgi:hypothetical protein
MERRTQRQLFVAAATAMAAWLAFLAYAALWG